MTSAPDPRARLDPLDDADLDEVLVLNELWVPHVGHLERSALESLLADAALALAARSGDRLDAFVIVLGAGADYASPNYRWFAQRHDRFTYVDRVAVADSARGTGIGRRLYEAVADHARSTAAGPVCAEVNLDPPNPGSLAFHERMGFEPVGRQWTYGDTVEVQLLEWRV